MATSAAIRLGDALPLRCGAQLGNRIAKAAMSEQLADARNAPSAELVRLYERWSGSGAGLLITGNVIVDRAALSEPRQVVVEDERDLPALERWARAATAHGAHAWMQINHSGRQVPRMLARHAAAPSAVEMAGRRLFAAPRAMSSQEVRDAIARFAVTARVAVKAGFTGVQVHAAHGYLISQFLSPLTNRRDDEWGGTPARRRRFLLEVVCAVREAIGADVPLAVKLNSADFQFGGIDEDESRETIAELAGHEVDLIELSGGTFESAAMMGADGRMVTRAREAYFLDFAETVRGLTTLPLMVTGGFRTAGAMGDALASGAVDVIGLARPLAVEPHIVHGLLARGSPGIVLAPRRLRVGSTSRMVQGLAEVSWYTRQLWRMGSGNDPAPARRVAPGVLHYLARQARCALAARR